MKPIWCTAIHWRFSNNTKSMERNIVVWMISMWQTNNLPLKIDVFMCVELLPLEYFHPIWASIHVDHIQHIMLIIPPLLTINWKMWTTWRETIFKCHHLGQFPCICSLGGQCTLNVIYRPKLSFKPYKDILHPCVYKPILVLWV
jgi:hypothetical protein